MQNFFCNKSCRVSLYFFWRTLLPTNIPIMISICYTPDPDFHNRLQFTDGSDHADCVTVHTQCHDIDSHPCQLSFRICNNSAPARTITEFQLIWCQPNFHLKLPEDKGVKRQQRLYPLRYIKALPDIIHLRIYLF